MEIQGNELRIICPPGMEIDKEHSTLECIKFKPIIRSWRNQNDNMISGYYLAGNGVVYLDDDYYNGNHDVFATKKQAKSALAMARISQIMANDERFGGVVTDEEWKDVSIIKHTIERQEGNIKNTTSITCYQFLAFHTREQRDLFLKENEDLIRDYLMID